MVNPFNIPDNPSTFYPNNIVPCDSDCSSRSVSSSNVVDGFINSNFTPSSLFFSYGFDVSACFRSDNSLAVSYRSLYSGNLYFIKRFVVVGDLKSNSFSYNRLLFFNASGAINSSQQEFLGCDLVPLNELVFTPSIPDDDYNLHPSFLVLPATIFASLFFIFLYKTFKRVLF